MKLFYGVLIGKRPLKLPKNAESLFCSSHHVAKKFSLFLLAQPVCIKKRTWAQNFINLCINYRKLLIRGGYMVDNA